MSYCIGREGEGDLCSLRTETLEYKCDDDDIVVRLVGEVVHEP